MFLENKYTKIYYQIVDRAKTRITEGYSERHHIVPKSLGGSDKKENLVSLTGREHFICHWLLTKMTANKAKQKMITAFIIMTGKGSKSAQNTKIIRTSKWFQKLREEYSKIVSEKNKGKIVSEETKTKLRQLATGRKMSDEVKKRQSERMKGKPRILSEEGRKKLIEASKKKKTWIVSEETRKKHSINNSGSNNPFFGKKHSPETLEKIKQHNLDPEIKRKRSERVMGELNPAKRLEVREKISKSQKIRLANKNKLKVDNNSK